MFEYHSSEFRLLLASKKKTSRRIGSIELEWRGMGGSEKIHSSGIPNDGGWQRSSGRKDPVGTGLEMFRTRRGSRRRKDFGADFRVLWPDCWKCDQQHSRGTTVRRAQQELVPWIETTFWFLSWNIHFPRFDTSRMGTEDILSLKIGAEHENTPGDNGPCVEGSCEKIRRIGDREVHVGSGEPTGCSRCLFFEDSGRRKTRERESLHVCAPS